MTPIRSFTRQYTHLADKTTYLYLLIDPRDGKIRYVGITSDPEKRMLRHLHKQRSMGYGFTLWNAKLESDKLYPIMCVIGKFAIKDDAVKAEGELIKALCLQGIDLLNNMRNPRFYMPRDSRAGNGANL